MGAVGGALGAIKGGDIGSLTNALGNLGGVAPNILTDVLGGRLPLSGIDVGGFGALGGLDFDLALASTFMSTAAAFLECDPPDVCPPTDTQTLSSGGKSKDESKSEKVNNTNIIDKVKATNIPSGDALKHGSFGISPEGAQQALTNRINQGIESTGIPANLPEGSFGITPKKKFNLPKINAGQSFSEFRASGNTRGFYNIPSRVTVNTNEFVVSEERGYQLLSEIDTYSGDNARLKNFRDEKNELIYQNVYGGTGRTIDYNGKIFNPGDDGYNNAFVEIEKIINESNN